MSDLIISDIRKAVSKLKHISKLKKPVKYYKMQVRNPELFEKFKKAGRLKETRPGSNCFELID